MKRLLLHTALFHSIRFPAGLLTLICAILYSQTNASALVPLTWFKLITTVVLLSYVNYTYRQRFYYYHNLHISKKSLLLGALATDILLYIVALLIVHQIYHL